MRKRWKIQGRAQQDAGPRCAGRMRHRRASLSAAVLLALITLPIPFVPARAQAAAGQDPTPDSVPSLPEAPQPQNLVRPRPKTPPCRVVPASEAAGLAATAMATRTASSLAGVQVPVTHSESGHAGVPPELPPCPPQTTNWYARFLNGPQVKPLTPKEKARLAVRNVVDPFNAVTILGTAAISRGHPIPTRPTAPACPASGATSASATPRT